MPIFEYTCKDCFHDFELIVLGEESPKCPQCGTENVEKMLSAHGFYSIKGNNSASITPKKYRGGKE